VKWISDAWPSWPARDWRAMIALLFSIFGAAVLTLFAWHLVRLLHHDADELIKALLADTNRALRDEIAAVLTTIIDTLAWGLKLLLGGVIAVLLSLGLAINRRTVKLSASGFEASGGDGSDDAPPARVTATTTLEVPVSASAPPPPPPAASGSDGELSESEKLK
jgi:hypothetical protein